MKCGDFWDEIVSFFTNAWDEIIAWFQNLFNID